ncbi:MAG: DUF167 domain-containing protein [Desulfovibrio sp.]|nr:DUF167 domain-containing protein [Desulfovibrio sp.]MCA1986507.1 DUF167 domain-containing protein [Desulfovibrio sp.]
MPTSQSARPPYAEPAGPGAWRLRVWVQPGAKSEGPAGEYQGCLKLKVAAPAVDNKANAALVKLVARALGCRASSVQVESGQTSRKKALRIELPAEPAWGRLAVGQAEP